MRAILWRSLAMAAVCGVSLGVAAQTPSAQPTPSENTNAIVKPSTPSAKATAKTHRADRHHAMSHHDAMARGRHRHDMAANGMGPEDSRYRADLRKCVEGPASGKDQCIDEAIRRHGHG